MSNESTTVRALKAELEHVEAVIARYTKTRKALHEVIDFLDSEQHSQVRRINESSHRGA